jgi:integrase
LQFLGKDPLDANAEDLRVFLLRFRDKSSYTYANYLKALKVFFRDYLGMPQVVSTFRFPHHEIVLKKLPTKEELKEFYEALPNLKSKTLFLIFASSGLRLSEVLDLKVSDIDMGKRMIIVNHASRTKKGWVSFFNEEAQKLLKEYIKVYKPKEKLFREGKHRRSLTSFIRARKKTGLNITPQILREWFCSEMGRLGVPDRFVDAFCGRVPKSVLARHYTDFSPEKLKEIYDEASLEVLN